MRIGPPPVGGEMLPNQCPASLTCPRGFSGTDGCYTFEILTHARYPSKPVSVLTRLPLPNAARISQGREVKQSQKASALSNRNSNPGLCNLSWTLMP